MPREAYSAFCAPQKARQYARATIRFGNGNKHQIYDLIAVVLFFLRRWYKALFYVIAYHRGRDFRTANRHQNAVDVLHYLFQVKTDGWKLLVTGKPKMFDGFLQALPYFGIHHVHYYNAKRTICQYISKTS